MKRRLFWLVIGLFMVSVSTSAQPEGRAEKVDKKRAVKIVTKMVTASDAGGKVACYLARPEGPVS